MGKNYDFLNPSDMDKFFKDVKKEIRSKAEEKALETMAVEVECPTCGKDFNARQGKSTCPHCGDTHEVNVNIEWS